MRIAFMGSPAFAVPALEALLAAGHEIVCVYSQPPRPAGRGQALRATPVAAFAADRGLEVRTPRSLKSPEAQEAFAALALDAAVVVAYGLILPKPILTAPRLGCLNLHASLLPRWRGAAPIQRAIMAGDAETGVEAMLMEEGLDTGPVLLSQAIPISPEDTGASLHDKLAAIGAPLLARALAGYAAGTLTPRPQAAEGVTYAHKLTSEEARLDWARPARELERKIRALNPAPGAWRLLPGPKGPLRLKILEARLGLGQGAPGEALDDRLLIACGEGALRLTRLQREGRGPQSAEEFLRGTPVPAGTRLE